MNSPTPLVAVTMLAVLMAVACSNSRGRPGPNSEVLPPHEITDFRFLYAKNCAACHGHEGKNGTAVSLGDPLFLAIADDAAVRRIAATGVPGTPMPAFATSAGGMLTDTQIDSIVAGIRSWAKPGHMNDTKLPPYVAEASGDPTRGADVYVTYCSSCHGPDGRGGKASSIVDGSYLSLVSDQQLRTIVIVGRPELGAPDWRNNVPGHPMSAQDISDVVAWLAEQRP
jgi:cytochrome c oxidase cbb3-type subunit III